MTRFEGRVALISGAARGIGFGVACRFASEGASVVVVDLDESAAIDAARLLPEGDPGRTLRRAMRSAATTCSRVGIKAARFASAQP